MTRVLVKGRTGTLGIRRLVVAVWLLGKFAAGYRTVYNTCPDNCQGKITWAQWVAREYGKGQ